jgi:hypothetical protein
VPAKRRLVNKSSRKIRCSDDEYEEDDSDEYDSELNDANNNNNIKSGVDAHKQPSKTKIKLKIEDDDDEDDDLELADRKESDNFSAIRSGAPKATSLDTSHHQDEDSEDNNSSSAGSSLGEGTATTFITNGEDVFVTDVTSGVVTVTIKECTSPEGFFKSKLAE